MHRHAFWSTQPVTDARSEVDCGPVEDEDKAVRADPFPLPDGYCWCTVDMTSAVQAQEVFSLLAGNYVEADDATFRFKYSVPFLTW
jgi:glycylpeptide N-tetradecanoyltransferase